MASVTVRKIRRWHYDPLLASGGVRQVSTHRSPERETEFRQWLAALEIGGPESAGSDPGAQRPLGQTGCGLGLTDHGTDIPPG